LAGLKHARPLTLPIILQRITIMAYLSFALRMEGSNAIDGSFARWIMDNNDTAATVDTNGYITDARAKGLQVGDLITYRQWANAPTVAQSNRAIDRSQLGALTAVSTHVVVAIAANGSANLSDPTAIVVTNTD
jgi:hypothetical protein